MRSTSASSQSDWRFSTRILLPVTFVTLAALALAAFSLFWAVRQSDHISVERQIRTTARNIQAVVGELAKQQEMIAVWDDAVEELNRTPLDTKWLDANVGIWLSRTFGQDEVYILNGRDEPVDATIDAARVSPVEFERIRPGISEHIEEVRGRPISHYREHATPFIASYLTTGKAVHDSHFLELLNRPAAVSIMKIVPESNAVAQEPGKEFLLVSVRYLDGGFVKQLSEQSLIEGLRFSRADTPSAGEVSVPLTSDVGDRIGYFIWKPELPGTKILRVIGPVTVLVCTLLVAMMALLVHTLRRSLSKLQRTVVELRASEAHAHHLAFHDVLTGLPNRALFEDRLDHAVARARHGGKAAVLMLDLDRFKNVNDTLGHQAGDCVVREFASRLVALLRPSDTVARLGGDEFAIVLENVGHADDVQVVCMRILEAVRQPFNILGHQVFVGVSIGVVLIPEAGAERVDLVRKADIALYRAKAEGRDAFRVFTPSMDETVQVRSTIEDELRAALAKKDEFRLYYQPLVAADGRSIIGLEALVRWQHLTRGLVEPRDFIPVAEEAGLISQLGDWILHEASLASLRWPDLSIAINLSPVQFRSGDFAERCLKIVRETGASPHRIELEITEGVLLDDNEISRAALTTLREAGFRIALDDFGTGYSSLGYLRRFEVDKIKIDRSFVQHLGQEEEAAAIVTAIITLCRTVGLAVTAEGVETEAQRRFLSATGCDEMQGFLFFRALPEEQVGGAIEQLGNPHNQTDGLLAAS